MPTEASTVKHDMNGCALTGAAGKKRGRPKKDLALVAPTAAPPEEVSTIVPLKKRPLVQQHSDNEFDSPLTPASTVVDIEPSGETSCAELPVLDELKAVEQIVEAD